jgi:EAL domain-containing protein (putative c-di-GMP-specific phosphodiesterase class I)
MAIVKAIVSLARELGKTVVAEGVETRVQMDILQKLNVTELQGYFFSKPVPIADLQEKLAEPRVIKLGQAA